MGGTHVPSSGWDRLLSCCHTALGGPFLGVGGSWFVFIHPYTQQKSPLTPHCTPLLQLPIFTLNQLLKAGEVHRLNPGTPHHLQTLSTC